MHLKTQLNCLFIQIVTVDCYIIVSELIEIYWWKNKHIFNPHVQEFGYYNGDDKGSNTLF